jgi:hypothetical protein
MSLQALAHFHETSRLNCSCFLPPTYSFRREHCRARLSQRLAVQGRLHTTWILSLSKRSTRPTSFRSPTPRSPRLLTFATRRAVRSIRWEGNRRGRGLEETRLKGQSAGRPRGSHYSSLLTPSVASRGEWPSIENRDGHSSTRLTEPEPEPELGQDG